MEKKSILRKDWPRIEKRLGFKLGPLRLISHGSYGHVYAIDQERVLKITASMAEYRNAKRLLGKNPKNLAKVFDCARIRVNLLDNYLCDRAPKDYFPENLSFIVYKRYRRFPGSQIMLLAVSETLDHLQHRSKPPSLKDIGAKLENHIDLHYYDLPPDLLKGKGQRMFIKRYGFHNIMREAKKFKVKINDYHFGNFLMDPETNSAVRIDLDYIVE